MRALALIAAIASSSVGLAFQAGRGAGTGRADGQPNAIVGRVTDSSGKPVPNVFVTALMPRSSAPRPFVPVSALLGAVTNAEGDFRLGGLNMGEFFVIALPHNAIATPDGRLNRAGFGHTFYPNASDVTAASVVAVAPMRPARADITLLPARLSVVSGTVIGSNGEPVQSGTLNIAHGDGLFGLDGRAIAIRPGGRVVLPALPPGTYFLQYREGAWPPPRGVIPIVSGAKVVVAGADVSGVRVVPIHMVRATGRLIVEPALRSTLQPSSIEIGASPVSFDGNPGPQRPGIVQDDWTFEMKTWPSQGRIRVFVRSEEWAVIRIRLDGVDVTDKPIDFVESRDVSGLEVEIARRRSPAVGP